ncbi:protein SAWADEE HOMEODOMAIN HOMOLOG 1-like isoform X1 [Nicotiana sylvestris]|uniref:protein SAWADEE HOMEODOMAIN HOMOLOG 1-like isoform X1 n=1 Tax=Nicotiana sylvestris TaxID=4096 RepID=UPI00388CADBF
MELELRPRKRQIGSFSGFSQTEIEKMENLINESSEQVCDPEFCKKVAKTFMRSQGRAGKPIVKWTEVQTWFQNKLQCCSSKDNSAEANQKLPDVTERCALDKANESSHTAGQKVPSQSELEFEARSSRDGACFAKNNYLNYKFLVRLMKSKTSVRVGDMINTVFSSGFYRYDVDSFISHRFLNSGEPEALVRFVSLGSEEDEWVNIRKAVRERSVTLENSECNKLKVGDLVLCFQEGKNQSKYLEAHVIEIQKRLHDIRGCRCLFVIRYGRDDTEETVRLRRLCVRPSILGRP